MTPDAVHRWIICITGWRQEGRLSGVEKIQDAIHRQCHGEGTRVLLKSWKDSMPDLANRIWNRMPEGSHPTIVIIAYSYGGWTAILLAIELWKRGLKIEVMLLIDAVWRLFDRFPSFLSLYKGWEIRFPKNILKCHAWRQEVDKPRGHKLIPNKNIEEFTEEVLIATHDRIDDAQTIFDKALAVACP